MQARGKFPRTEVVVQACREREHPLGIRCRQRVESFDHEFHRRIEIIRRAEEQNRTMDERPTIGRIHSAIEQIAVVLHLPPRAWQSPKLIREVARTADRWSGRLYARIARGENREFAAHAVSGEAESHAVHFRLLFEKSQLAACRHGHECPTAVERMRHGIERAFGG